MCALRNTLISSSACLSLATYENPKHTAVWGTATTATATTTTNTTTNTCTTANTTATTTTTTIGSTMDALTLHASFFDCGPHMIR